MTPERRARHVYDPTGRYDYRHATVEGGDGSEGDPVRLAYPPTPTERMTPDELVGEIMRIQQERDPATDPGDMVIEVQDDSALHSVSQNGVMYAIGGSIQNVLENALALVKVGRDTTAYWMQAAPDA